MKLFGVPRGRWAALGLVAILAAMLQPLCAAYAAGHDVDHEAVQCCAEIDTGAVVASPAAAAGAIALAASGVAAIAVPGGTAVMRAQSYRLAAWNDPPPLPSLPYHARSARIQR
jgi:hypothetical protein